MTAAASDKPIRERSYSAFLSCAHAEKALVDRLYSLLSTSAGLPLLYDSDPLSASKADPSVLPNSICQCRALLLIVCKESLDSGWVKEQFDYAVRQRAQHSEFRVISIRIDGYPVPDYLESSKWVHLSNGQIDFNAISDVLEAFYDFDIALDLNQTRDVYVSRSWRESEAALPASVCRAVASAGFRLVGDSKDQLGFDEGARCESILQSCGGFLAIAPDRGDGATSRYILKEIELAKARNLPGVIVAEPSVKLPDAGLTVVRVDPAKFDPAQLSRALEDLKEQWRTPAHPHYVFFGTDLDQANQTRNRKVRSLIQCVTGMSCMMGEDLRGDHIQMQIRDRIARAFLMIADISEDNLNTSVEAGIARGAGTTLHLVAREPRQRPTFMFRDLQVFYYADDAELVGVVHRILHPYRRRIINYELN